MDSIITIISTIIIMNIINVGIEIFILTVNTINNSNTRQDLDAGTLLDCGWGSPYLPAPPLRLSESNNSGALRRSMFPPFAVYIPWQAKSAGKIRMQ